MAMSRSQLSHTYQMLLSDDLKGCAQRIEFEAPDALRAMSLARDSLREREIELFEDGEPLGKLLCDPNGYLKVIVATDCSPMRNALPRPGDRSPRSATTAGRPKI